MAAELIQVRKRGRRRGGGRGGPLFAPEPPPCAAEEKNRLLTGKQGQSPCMSTCGSDLHTHAALTGKKTTQIPANTNMHAHVLSHTHRHNAAISPTTYDTQRHTHMCKTHLSMHNFPALLFSIHLSFFHPSPCIKNPPPSACLHYQPCLCKSDRVSRSHLAQSLLTHTHPHTCKHKHTPTVSQ